MNSKKQKYIIENLLASRDAFSRCVNILKPEYFEKEYKLVVKFLLDYYGQYNGMPTVDMVVSELDVKLKKQETLTLDQFYFVCDEVEKFCKESALKDAIMLSLDDIEEEEFGKVSERISEAITVSLERDLGVELFNDDIEEYLKSLIDSLSYEPLGLTEIDKNLGGGIARKQFTLFSANSGGGKSIMLNNIGLNFANRGYNVLLISLELSEEMIALRSAFIETKTDTEEWKARIPEMSAKIKNSKQHSGSFMIKRLPNGASANDIRSYIKHYELEKGFRPDMLIVDYIDLMGPNGGARNVGIFEQDKLKAEQLAELGHIYDMYLLSASQQNREALKSDAPDQGVIAGGISKVNTVDNYISLYMNPNMRLQGEMMAFFLKTRSSDGVGKSALLSFNSKTLVIGNHDGSGGAVMPTQSSKKDKENLNQKITGDIPDMPGFERDSFTDESVIEQALKDATIEKGKKEFDIDKVGTADDLLDLMEHQIG